MINQKIKISILNEWLKLWEKLYSWNSIEWFMLELDPKESIIKNIVFIIGTNKAIHTIVDEWEKIKTFILKLEEIWIPLFSDINQTFIEKLIRKLKL